MKFNPRSPRVLLTFMVVGINILIASLVAVLLRSKRGRVVLFGHNFYGSLRAVHEYSEWREIGIDCRYLSIDHRAYRRYLPDYPNTLSALRIDHVVWAARADALVMDRSPGVLGLLKALRPRIRTVQLWHGIGYKPWPPEHLASFKAFDMFCVPSAHFRDIWHSDGIGPDLDKMRVTGLPRSDFLVRPLHGKEELLRLYGLGAAATKRVLIAPTWKQDDRGRSVVPFGMDPQEFFSALDGWARDKGVQVVFRSHLNTTTSDAQPKTPLEVADSHQLRFMPMSEYPYTEDLLLVADVLVSDWSGISTDFLILDRPAIFLDVPEPFQPGTRVLTPDDRYGPRVDSIGALLAALDTAIDDPEGDLGEFSEIRDRVVTKAFGNTLDGMCSQRCLGEILDVIGWRRELP